MRQTQKAIKHALTERYYAFEEARRVAVTDPEVDLEAAPGTQAYRPSYSDVSTQQVVLIPQVADSSTGAASGGGVSSQGKRGKCIEYSFSSVALYSEPQLRVVVIGCLGSNLGDEVLLQSCLSNAF